MNTSGTALLSLEDLNRLPVTKPILANCIYPGSIGLINGAPPGCPNISPATSIAIGAACGIDIFDWDAPPETKTLLIDTFRRPTLVRNEVIQTLAFMRLRKANKLSVLARDPVMPGKFDLLSTKVLQWNKAVN